MGIVIQIFIGRMFLFTNISKTQRPSRRYFFQVFLEISHQIVIKWGLYELTELSSSTKVGLSPGSG
jgi:hypothetical protein